jgi:histidine triad (HIT) family protein
MTGIFARIASGEIKSYKIAENENFFAFLDVNPLVKGHTLVIPKKEFDYIFDLDDQLYSEFLLFAKGIAKAIKKAIPCKRIGVAVIGLEVPHAHIHLVPLNNMDDINFSRPKIKLSEKEFEEIAGMITSNLK